MTDTPPPSGLESTADPQLSANATTVAPAGSTAASAPGLPVEDAQLTSEDLDLLVRAAAEANASGSEGPVGASAPKRGRPAGSGNGANREASPGADPLDLPEFASGGAGPISVDRISMLSDVTLNVKIELGRTRMLVEDVLRLDAGSVVELDKLAGDPVDVFANDRLIARGEVLVLNDSFCVRISEVFAGDPHRVV